MKHKIPLKEMSHYNNLQFLQTKLTLTDYHATKYENRIQKQYPIIIKKFTKTHLSIYIVTFS